MCSYVPVLGAIKFSFMFDKKTLESLLVSLDRLLTENRNVESVSSYDGLRANCPLSF